MKRKIIVGVLVLVLAVLATVGLAACDDGDNGAGGNSGSTPPNYTPPEYTQNETLTFELNDDSNGYVVTGLAEGVTDANIIIPAIYNSLPVTAIGEQAFAACRNLTSVTISQNVSVIGSSAFQNCTSLRSLRFNTTSGLREIGANALQNCTSLATVTIPDSVVSVGDRAFQGCTALKTVTIGNGVQTVGVEAFRGCSKLSNVTIGNGLKQLGQNAFLNCGMIEKMSLPNSLESIGLGALEGCTGLKELSIPFVGAQKYINPINDEQESIEKNTHFGYVFGIESFKDQSSLRLDVLQTVTITGGSPIGYHAFDGIGRFTDAQGTKAIGLSTIVITGNVRFISTGAFQGCQNLHTLVLPKSIAVIGGQILGNTLIERVYYCGSVADWANVDAGGASNNHHLFGNQYLVDPRCYYSETEPTTSGNYWHYVDGVPTMWE